ncbi:MAG: hypothetical protein GY761_18515 [Hyphomicrobiales bacterium]|nr:hypothetical protein [Hyphomicrobiales bacterium]
MEEYGYGKPRLLTNIFVKLDTLDVRIAGVVVPDLPHHVTQHGNRREPVIFDSFGTVAVIPCILLFILYF